MSATANALGNRRVPNALLTWYFVLMWGSGFVATKAGLQYAAPFTFLSLRFAFGVLCMGLVVAITRPHWPQGARQWRHVVVAGLLMHAVNLSGSHYAQYLGLSAGITALLLATQPLLTAAWIAWRSHQTPSKLQWLGLVVGLAGVVFVVGHKIDVRTMTMQSLAAVAVSLLAITSGTLYQRRHIPDVDLRAATFVQFVVSLIVLAPLAMVVEGAKVHWSWTMAVSIVYLVIGASILAVGALHVLMRRGEATRVTSLLYLTPAIAVATEWAIFGVVPTLMSAIGIVITSAGVALVSARPCRAD
ncbi:MAG TPA: DMT family transporter [Burkholderiaceae bacterium]|nr:DMT family transporter [Burkholderiaceae bacterium]